MSNEIPNRYKGTRSLIWEAFVDYVMDFLLWWKTYTLTAFLIAMLVIEYLHHGKTSTSEALIILIGFQGLFSCTKDKE